MTSQSKIRSTMTCEVLTKYKSFRRFYRCNRVLRRASISDIKRSSPPFIIEHIGAIYCIYIYAYEPLDMSGFEVTGIVLGVIPLIISAVENYEVTFQPFVTYCRYSKELREFRASLATQKQLFENQCIILGLVWRIIKLRGSFS